MAIIAMNKRPVEESVLTRSVRLPQKRLLELTIIADSQIVSDGR
jgi:hypothetical protein